MRNFNITVNGKTYFVEVEEAGVSAQTAPVQPAPVAAQPVQPAVRATQPAPVQPKPAAKPVAGGASVKAPMPGLILELAVADGATVKKNDKILVMEAMKMEHDIVATADGQITFTVKKGDNVESGSDLAFIK